MTELSLAAQAVLDAANTRNSYGPNDCLNESRWIAAAALRAVAEQLGESRAPGAEFEDLYARIIEVDELLAIATELEGAL